MGPSEPPDRVSRWLGSAAGLFGLLLSLLGACAPAERLVFRGWMRLTPSPADPRIALCPIDAASGPWPWSPARLAELIDRLAEGGARVIALDLDLTSVAAQADGEEHAWELEALAASIAAAGRVVLATDGGEVPELLARGAPLRAFRGRPAFPGSGELPLTARIGSETLPRLALAGVRGLGEPAAATGSGLRPRFRGPQERFPAATAGRVLAGEAAPGLFEDRLVFVGVTEGSNVPSIKTPFGEVAPLVAEAQVAENLLTRDALKSPPLSPLLAGLAALGFGLALAAGGTAWPRRRWPLIAGCALALAWPVASWAAFAVGSWQLPLFPPLLAAGLSVFAVFRLRFLEREQQVRAIRQTWGEVLPAALVEAGVADPARLEFPGERASGALLVVELTGAPAWADGQEAAPLFARAARLLGALRRAVVRFEGAVEGRGAEGLRAVFGAPVPLARPAVHACRAALSISGELSKEGLRAQLGLAFGPVAVGATAPGSLALFGGAVEQAARLAKLNRTYGTEILLSEEVAAEVRERFLLRELDRVRLSGEAAPRTLFELVSGGSEEPRDRQRVVRFESGLAAYRKREFVRAERLFASIIEDLGADPPSQIFAERCRKFRAAPPPEGWDGTAAFNA